LPFNYLIINIHLGGKKTNLMCFIFANLTFL